jgi:hypothetical protein
MGFASLYPSYERTAHHYRHRSGRLHLAAEQGQRPLGHRRAVRAEVSALRHAIADDPQAYFGARDDVGRLDLRALRLQDRQIWPRNRNGTNA